MTQSVWHREDCGPGRQYILGHETNKSDRFKPEAEVIQTILEDIKGYLVVEPAIRLVLDSAKVNPERVVLALPAEGAKDQVMENFAAELYRSLLGYYLGSSPKSSHYGISQVVMEGNVNNFVRREAERLFGQMASRPDMASRVLENAEFGSSLTVGESGTNHLTETVTKALNIYVGYRLHLHGEGINKNQMFIPLEGGQNIIDLVYYNLEQIVNQNFLSYDETGNSYLQITEGLVFKELECLLQRSKDKENTRKKILTNIEYNLVFSTNPRAEFNENAGDHFYDVINHVEDEKLKESTKLSSELYATVVTKSKELLDLGISSGKSTGITPGKSTKVPAPPEKVKVEAKAPPAKEKAKKVEAAAPEKAEAKAPPAKEKVAKK
ncbi:MAG: hypothetical protein QNL04_14975 [SAR324 cluster bacterium]|nr:hypothetical protein [SAR324 cluster bacterium]